MKQKFLTVLLAIVAAFCLCFGLAACGKDGDGGTGGEGTCKHQYTADNVCILCGEEWGYTKGLNYVYDEETDTYAVGENVNASGKVILPYGYQGKFVTKIGRLAFSGYDGTNSFYSELTSITIPNCVTSIGDGAFALCTGLTSVTIPDGTTLIGNSAFFGCDGLMSVTIGNGVTEIGNGAFYECRRLAEIAIPDSVTSIGDGAFADCSGLTGVILGNGVAEIGEGAFENCYKLVEVWNHSSLDIREGDRDNGEVAHYADHVYSGNEASKRTVTDDGYIFYEDEECLLGYCGTEKSLTLPAKSSYGDDYWIYQYAFYYYDVLTSVTIPDSVTWIGREAFRGCTGLTSITIPDSVTGIGENAFEGCRGLTRIEIPDSVTSIGSCAFYNCSGLTSVTIGHGVTEIQFAAFGSCSELTDIQFKGTVAEWQTIQPLWSIFTDDYTVTCTDGTVDEKGNVTYFD